MVKLYSPQAADDCDDGQYNEKDNHNRDDDCYDDSGIAV